jgi:alpha-1,2-mannosyltransferase
MSAGMFYASPSVLPSSFTMIQFMFAYASWLSGKQLVSMMLVANAVLVGWPFVGLLGIPLLLPVERRLPPGRFVVLAGVYAASTLAVMTLVDSAYYGRIHEIESLLLRRLLKACLPSSDAPCF